MKQLQDSLNQLFGFRGKAARRPDTGRKDREWAKPVAKEYGIEIERLGGGWNVWPPKQLTSKPGWFDPYEGDHFCQDWAEVRSMVSQYAHDCGQR